MNKTNNPFLVDIKSVIYNGNIVTDLINKCFDDVNNKQQRNKSFKDNIDIVFSDKNTAFGELKYDDTDPVGNIKNWLRYRILNNLGTTYDCDCNHNIFNMYNRILGTKNKQKNVNRERDFKVANYLLETDTMNSFATIFNQFMRDIVFKDAKNQFIDQLNDNNTLDSTTISSVNEATKWDELYAIWYKIKYGISIPGGNESQKPYRDYYFLKNIDYWYNNPSEETSTCFDEFNKFAQYTHCLANMILVPKGFNFSGRASATYDYWDLSLELLKSYQWYCNNLDKFLLEGCFNSNGSIALLPAHPHYNNSFTLDKYLNCLTEINKRIEARAEALAEHPNLKNNQFRFTK